MAVLAGIAGRDDLTPAQASYTTNAIGTATINQTAAVFDSSSPARALNGSALAPGARAMIARSLAGVAERSFVELWYDRVHVLPGRLDLGNVTGAREIAVEVWNAHADARGLSAVTSGGTEGLDLAGDVPHTFAALESRTYTLTVAASGPVTFDELFVLHFPDELRSLAVTGTRVVVFSYRPNWAQVLNESFAWLTDIDTARDGTEQRRSIRSRPRRTFEFAPLLADARMRRRFGATLAGWQHRKFAVPVWQDVTALDSAADAGSTALALDTRTRDFEPGGVLCLWSAYDDFETAEIDTVADDGVTLKRATLRAWPAGTPVLPLRLASLPANLQVTKLTATVAAPRVVFAVDAAEVSTRRAVAGGRTVYRDADVYLRLDSHNEDPSIDYERALDPLDFQTGYFRQESPTLGSVHTSDFRAIFSSRAEVSDFLAWLEARRGRAAGVWVPTWDFDFEMSAPVNAAASAMIVEAFGYARQFCDAAGEPAQFARDLMFVRNDGSIFFRRVTSASESVDGETETINLDQTFGADLAPEDVDRICFLKWRRLDADALTLAWITDGAAQVAFRFRDLLEAT
jgi:hypothetical protein